MKSGLQQANSRELSFGSARQYRLHEHSSNAGVLRTRLDGDGSNAGNRRALIEAIAADDAPVGFRHYAVEAGVRKHHREKPDGVLGRRQIGRKIVG